MQANEAAYDAPLAIDPSKLEATGTTSSASASASSSSGVRPGTSDLYGAALAAGLAGRNIDPNGQDQKDAFLNTDLKDSAICRTRSCRHNRPSS